MNRANPWFILRNYLAQQAIDAADRGDDAELLRLMDVLRRSYTVQPGDEARTRCSRTERMTPLGAG